MYFQFNTANFSQRMLCLCMIIPVVHDIISSEKELWHVAVLSVTQRHH